MTATKDKGINWLTAIVMAIYHILAVVALFHFSWTGVAVAAGLWFISGSLGIGVGYHRLLTHRGFRCPKLLEYFFAICGTLALEGGPIFWVGVHRIHHQLTDREGDPHSPRDGKWWSHMGWILTGRALHQKTEQLAPYVPDLRRDKFYLGSADTIGSPRSWSVSLCSTSADGTSCSGASSSVRWSVCTPPGW